MVSGNNDRHTSPFVSTDARPTEAGPAVAGLAAYLISLGSQGTYPIDVSTPERVKDLVLRLAYKRDGGNDIKFIYNGVRASDAARALYRQASSRRIYTFVPVRELELTIRGAPAYPASPSRRR